MQYGKSQEAIDRLTAEQRRVTQEAGTERPFTGEYNDRTEPGVRGHRLRRASRIAAQPTRTGGQ
jgi:peptide methionine sulfoxide reductase MsrB